MKKYIKANTPAGQSSQNWTYSNDDCAWDAVLCVLGDVPRLNLEIFPPKHIVPLIAMSLQFLVCEQNRASTVVGGVFRNRVILDVCLRHGHLLSNMLAIVLWCSNCQPQDTTDINWYWIVLAGLGQNLCFHLAIRFPKASSENRAARTMCLTRNLFWSSRLWTSESKPNLWMTNVLVIRFSVLFWKWCIDGTDIEENNLFFDWTTIGTYQLWSG